MERIEYAGCEYKTFAGRLPVEQNLSMLDAHLISMANKGFVRKFVLDASANYIFFVPLYIVLNTVTVFFGLPHWDLSGAITYALTALFGSFLLGGVYGRVLDSWRKRLKYR